ncbi:putative tubulin--tyrosine ligase PBY1 [Neolecta irregularis DAH-3]|uniref:Putative tubulin--tyrosine ligase PBY1 n=1 Tax=Neolecta irregularis (strain DAH-3) TaxID=1198029 RepID=A0A1U7LQN5_NEOID|nr:putative tubulin--tyrosine ligase PBY1 [Neolecta irregularis DAH-3]|eukprot:OLL24938.1 putative tubulin--tyrosine ligase PBY1 [Neolecta irregularis DAH-3]
MHVLISNDDGPPDIASPYISQFIETLKSETDWDISVALPNTQKSWISKAFLLGDLIKLSWYNPQSQSFSNSSKSSDDWALLDGTPASCVNIGLHHLFNSKPPIDLVLVGPNYGRNTTAVFAMGSGTIGGTMEAALQGRKGIALSFAFDRKNPVTPEGLQLACIKTVEIIKYLHETWADQVGLYAVNVPLGGDITKAKVFYTHILQNIWGSCFSPVEEGAQETGPNQNEIQVRKQESQEFGLENEATLFKFTPKFITVYESVDRANDRMSDGWIIKEGHISITPLKATFQHVKGLEGEIHL